MPQYQDINKKQQKFNIFDAKKKMSGSLNQIDKGNNKFSQNGNTSNMKKFFDIKDDVPLTYEESILKKKKICVNCDASGNHIIPSNKSYLRSLK